MSLKTINNLTKSVLINNFTRHENKGTNHLLLYKLSRSWDAILGVNLSTKTRIWSIQDCNMGYKKLIVRVLNSADIIEINNYRLLFQERVNLFLGVNLIIDTAFTS
jgi:hypothetical protein